MAPISDKHEFALYCADLHVILAHKAINDVIILNADDLVHRIKHVLRLQIGESCILFNAEKHATMHIEALEKKHITVRLQAYEVNKAIQPELNVLLPILKKEALEESLYAATELGATHIYLVTTKKIHSHQWRDHDMARAQKIIIAAAEQAKNFALPQIHAPQSLQQVLALMRDVEIKIFFEPTGAPALQVIQQVQQKQHARLALLVGPEADLAPEEKQEVQAAGFTWCALTLTILRAQQAVVVGLGIFRACLRS